MASMLATAYPSPAITSFTGSAAMEASILQRRTIELACVRCSLRALGAALVASAALASCGGGQDETSGAATTSDDAKVVVRQYFAAFARGEADLACELMTEVAQRGTQQLPPGERADSCEAATKELRRDALVVPRPQVRDLRVSGDTATARVTSEDPPYDSAVLLRRVDGGWRIAFPVAVVSKLERAPGIRPHDDEPNEGE